jgi:hypothetical protein
MRLVGFLLVASVALALMQAAAKLAALLVIVMGVGTFAARPRESIGCVAMLILTGFVGRFPVASMLLIAFLAILGWHRSESRKTGDGADPRKHSE